MTNKTNTLTLNIFRCDLLKNDISAREAACTFTVCTTYFLNTP
ncbi:hypothetical protein MED222_05810 [Vibrio sp. MED222]|nr:hypothetical protein MED222_05810 [Vibrio sp. MED222]